MRIGIDARLWNESGVGRYIRNLVSQLQKIDKKNEYVLFVLDKDTKEILHFVQNDIFRIVTADIRWHTLEEQLKFPQILNKENLDLMHFPYFSVPLLYNRPFVVTIHDLILHHFPTGQASTLPLPIYWVKMFGYKFIMLQTAQKAKKIIAVSNATKQEIVDHLGIDKEKIIVSYEGVDDKITNSKLQFPTYKLQPTNYFLYVGNAYPHKNLERMLMAFAEFRIQNSEFRMILVGKEDYFYKRLKEKIKKMGLVSSVVFYGFAADEELANLYKNAQALIMPSLMEGFGLPVLEAMANKCPVIVSDIPVHREIAGDAAIYFDPLNIGYIAKKIESIDINDKIQKGLERVKMFSWEKMAKDTLAVYESCISL